MACFIVPLTEALVVSAAKAVFLKKNDSRETVLAAREKVLVLEKMLYGGSFLLAAEHVVHGEVTFIPPFLTALESAEETSVMFHEMGTVGVAMAVLVTAAWGIGTLVSHLAKKGRLSRNSAEAKSCI